MLGKGVYQLSEVSRYAKLPPSTVRAWFKWRSDKRGQGPLFHSDYESSGGDFAVSFLDLIDAYVARFFREKGVRPPHIRRAYAVLQGELNVAHPFASTDLCTDGVRIIRRHSESELVEVVSKQKLFSEMQSWLKHISYDMETKLAIRWSIAEGVTIDPQLSFGKPVVSSRAITTFVLANQYHANRKNAGLVADLYSVDKDDVLNAVRFETSLNGRRAA